MALKANELRIGNWLYGNDPQGMGYNEKGYFKVDSIEENMINAWRVEGFSTDCAGGDPIPLTAEILEKCGFEYFAWPAFLDFTHFIKDDFLLRQQGSDGPYSFFNTSQCDNSERQYIRTVTYVHQLQNLYFAITGNELLIKF